MTIPLTPVVVTGEEGDPNGRVLYALQPKQLECFDLTPLSREPDEPYPEHIGYGGAAGGGKSHLARATAVAAAFQWPGSRTIIFRRTEGEVKENHVTKFRSEVPDVIDGVRMYGWNGDDLCATWENGSRTYFGYLKVDDDVFRYQGPEYDIMIFEEATHYSDFQIKWLTGNRLRATVDGSRPFCLYPSNPGSRGHYWYKRLFIDRRYREEEGEAPEQYAFVQARLSDNKVLTMRDHAYARRLDKLPEPWRSWQRDGDFHAGAGAMLSELDRDVHFVRPFKVPDHWERVGSFDWGYAHPWVFGEYAISEDGVAVKLQTVSGLRELPNQIAAKIRENVVIERLSYITAGHDTWAKVNARGDHTPSIAEQLEEHGISCIPANINRVQGLQALKRMLDFKTNGVNGGEGMPHLVFMDNQGNRETVYQLEQMVPDPDNLEDVLKVNADELGRGGDDRYDETRYFAASRPASASEQYGDTTVDSWSASTLSFEAEQKHRHVDELIDPDHGLLDPMFGDIL